MPISVRRACYDSDRQDLVDVLQANLPYRSHAQFFSWLYRANPDGEAVAWLAMDSCTDRVVGIAAAFPRRLYCGGAIARGYMLGDFCIAPEYRSLGLAVTLQRACLDGLATQGAFVFDFPSRSMLAVYKRMRIDASATLIRHAKPLRADRKVAEHVPVRVLSRGFSVVANVGLRLRDNRAENTSGCTVAVEKGPCGEEFTEATREWSPRVGVCVARTANYLNWRYQDHPAQSYEMLTARHGDRLRGYLMQHIKGEDCTIDDLLAEDDAVCSDLLAAATALARKRRVHTLNVLWLATYPGRRVLEKCGFHPRESSPVVLLTLPQMVLASTDWYLTLGDWEN